MKAIAIPACMLVLLAGAMSGGEAASSAVTVDIAKMRCKELMAGNDTDREAGISFYHGYLAGKKNSQTLDVNAAAAQTNRVVDFCLSDPTSTVMDAFIKTGT